MTLKLQKARYSLALVIAGMALASASAEACYTVKVSNKTKSKVKVDWVALGCFNIADDTSTVCDNKSVNAGETKSYKYNWGLTVPNVVVNVRSPDTKKYDQSVVYVYDGRHFRPGSYTSKVASPDSCGHTYHIQFTEENLQDLLNSQT